MTEAPNIAIPVTKNNMNAGTDMAKDSVTIIGTFSVNGKDMKNTPVPTLIPAVWCRLIRESSVSSTFPRNLWFLNSKMF